MRNRNPEQFGGGCVLSFFGLLVALAIIAVLAGRLDVLGALLGALIN
jgi:hypothetical protein